MLSPALQRSDHFEPNVIDTNVDGVDGCLIKDIVSPHPTREGLWRIVGRVDDQIMHSTGEKTNPGPLGKQYKCKLLLSLSYTPWTILEPMLMSDPHVSGAVMFGRSRFNVGVLVCPKEAYAFDHNDESQLSEFRSLIW